MQNFKEENRIQSTSRSSPCQILPACPPNSSTAPLLLGMICREWGSIAHGDPPP
ncbi:hypothetical protein C8R44DRAFT_822229 [Mycena epipterygia]|nr:hypothetical protein C8R44DRAFT_822229 [Mycena epipterygia]